MLWKTFEANRKHLEQESLTPTWDTESGLSPEALKRGADLLIGKLTGCPKPLIKAELFKYVLSNARIAVDPKDLYQARLQHGDIVREQRRVWQLQIDETVMASGCAEGALARSLGAFFAGVDFGHTSPDWDAILRLGVSGLLERIRKTRQRKQAAGSLSEEERNFYDASEIVYGAVIEFILRLADGAEKMARQNESELERMTKCAENLKNIASRPPKTLHEALQLGLIYYDLQEIEGEMVRSQGGFDRLYYRFYQADLDGGFYTDDQEREVVRYYFYNLNNHRNLNDEPFCLSGLLEDGSDATNPLTYIALEIYDELNVPYIKIQLRLHSGTPIDLIRRAIVSIRNGKSSLLFINDEQVIPSLVKTGVTEAEARNYLAIGCYEPAVMGLEVPCTLNAMINMAKAVELAIFNGVDPLTGTQLGPKTGDCDTFSNYDEFYTAVQEQLAFMIKTAMKIIVDYEGYYMEINPSPLFSGTLADCVEKGCDAYAGGARYNNSSIVFACLGSAVDSLCAVRDVVYRQHEVSLVEFAVILKNNWACSDSLRLKALGSHEKWGNNKPGPDSVARNLTDFVSGIVNNKPNARGGVFKSGLWSINHYINMGDKTGATPDGRLAHAPLSKNVCPVTAMDREGVTALINSALKIDFTNFANGSVLDIMLHPTAVQGEDGLEAMLCLVNTFFRHGGYTIHGNVFDANTLKNAQNEPEKYANLQVRVCGWNTYFVNLSKAEQDEFIKQAESIAV